MKRMLCAVLLNLLVCNLCHAKYFRWAIDIGGYGVEIMNDIATDPSGNVISTGRFSNGNGGVEVFIHKTDANGKLIWTKILGDVGWDEGYAVKTDATGNIYIIGRFNGIVDFDPGPAKYSLTSQNASYDDVFILKLDASGNFVWAVQRQSPGGTGESIAGNTDLAIDNSNNIYITYSFSTPSRDFQYMIVEKTNNTGTKMWSYKVAATIDYSIIKDCAVTLDVSGNVVVSGTFSGTFVFDANSPGKVTQVHNNTGFILKLNNSGSYTWSRILWGLLSNCNIYDVTTTNAAGDIYLGGSFSGIVDFDPTPGINYDTSSSNMVCMYLLKLSDTGGFKWVKTFAGNNMSAINKLAPDAAGNIYATGYFYDQLTFRDAAPAIVKTTVNSTDDAFTMKFNSSGNVEWVRQMGGPANHDIGYALALYKGNIYTGGAYYISANFDWDGPGFNMVPIDNVDAFICKYSECPLTDTSVRQSAGNVLTANATGAAYQWINCTGQSPVPGATSRVFTATSPGSYAVVITQGNCNDTSSCYTVSTLDISSTPERSVVSVYPNPNNGYFTIKGIGTDKNTTVVITDIYGRQVSASQVRMTNEVRIRLDAAAGVYFVTITSAAGKQIEKLMVH